MIPKYFLAGFVWLTNSGGLGVVLGVVFWTEFSRPELSCFVGPNIVLVVFEAENLASL